MTPSSSGMVRSATVSRGRESFTVPEPYDAAVCLFSSISYLHGDETLARVLGSFAAAVRPGGVLVIEPFVSPDAYREGAAFLQTYDGAGLKCARASVSAREGDLAVLRFGWIVARDGATSVEHFTETHELWLCDHERLARAVRAAGFDLARTDLQLVGDRELVVAIRRP
jgi:SAM-dependent methyltransferase